MNLNNLNNLTKKTQLVLNTFSVMIVVFILSLIVAMFIGYNIDILLIIHVLWMITAVVCTITISSSIVDLKSTYDDLKKHVTGEK